MCLCVFAYVDPLRLCFASVANHAQLVNEMKAQGVRYTLWSNFWWIASRRCGSRVTYNEVRLAVRVLHDAGELIYVDVPESRRRDFVVFDPQWLSNTLASVVLASVLDMVRFR